MTQEETTDSPSEAQATTVSPTTSLSSHGEQAASSSAAHSTVTPARSRALEMLQSTQIRHRVREAAMRRQAPSSSMPTGHAQPSVIPPLAPSTVNTATITPAPPINSGNDLVDRVLEHLGL